MEVFSTKFFSIFYKNTQNSPTPFPSSLRNSETCWLLYSEVFEGKPYSLYQGVPFAQCCSSSHPAPYNGVKTLIWTEYPDFHVQYDENMIDTVPSLKVSECARIICSRPGLRPGCRLVVSPAFISVEIFDRQLKCQQFWMLKKISHRNLLSFDDMPK